jgi:hypothetical protein
MTLPFMLSRRRGFLALLSAVAVAASLVVVTVGSEHSASATGASHTHAATTPRTAVQVQFHDQMRKLWEDHVTWTRLAIVTFADGSDGSDGFEATATRLLQNQSDIGDAIKPFYGEAAGNQLTSLLHDHITIAVQLLQAAKAGDTTAFEQARTGWYANADDIADFLATANPRYWSRDVLRAAMSAHLDQTLAEAAHELNSQYAASVADYDEIHHHILAMADLLSSGIMRAFPARFH